MAVAPGEARLSTPRPTLPANGAIFDSVPSFAWSGVSGAAGYEFQIAADPGMNSPVLGRGKDQFQTRNLRATLIESIPNGTYYWRVRAIKKTGDTSPWSRPSSFQKRWSGAATLQTPIPNQSVRYPSEPLRLSWTPVPHAASYAISIATDPSLASLVGGKPIETVATSFTRTTVLPASVYYWGVTPLDAQGNPGVPSSVSSFRWEWPSQTTPQVTDLAPEPEFFDPQFGWNPVPGAARYEVEVNSSQDFAPGSKVCCASPTIATSLSPTVLFKDNVYYWRVRAIDIDGNAGVWNVGPSFTKAFDKVPPVGSVEAPSVKNLHMRDNLRDPGTDASPDQGYQTRVPVLAWNPVPGASSYQVEVTPYETALGGCNWSASDLVRWQVMTAGTAWTPLGTGLRANPPFGSPTAVARESTDLVANKQYCARVRARSDRDSTGKEIFGDYTYLDDGLGWAFQWLGATTDAERVDPCNGTYLCAADYVEVARGATVGRTPLFTWRPVKGKGSYFVIVAKDAAFTNVVDYAFTQVPAYAPRGASQPTTYADETTAYYWVVLPAGGSDGTGSTAGNPFLGAPADFHKRSTPPALSSPENGANLLGQPTFRWTSTDGARRYRLQVAQDPSFGNPIDDVTTDSTAYTSDTTYPADTVLYWRVRADDENRVGLAWSATGTFQKRLPAPVLSPTNPTEGDYVPTWTWDPACSGACAFGAVSYDLAADLPDGTHREIKGIRTGALTPTLMYGTGIFRWRIRANFPTLSSTVVPGPYSPTAAFTRTIGEPGGVHADFSKKHILLAWEPEAGAKNYRVQISERADFARFVEQVTTDNTSYAPPMTQIAYQNAAALYWRVAALDEGRNVGDYSAARKIARAKTMQVVANRSAMRGRRVAVTITARDAQRRPLRLVAIRVAGAGVRPAARRTNANGKVTFQLTATKRGTVTYRATKTGYEPALLQQRVR